MLGERSQVRWKHQQVRGLALGQRQHRRRQCRVELRARRRREDREVAADVKDDWKMIFLTRLLQYSVQNVVSVPRTSAVSICMSSGGGKTWK